MIELSIYFYSFSALVNFLASASFAILVFVINRKPRINRIFVVFGFSISFWSIFYFFWTLTSDAAKADFFVRTCMIGVLFIAPTFLDFVVALSHAKISKWFLRGNYIASCIIALFVYSPFFASKGAPYLIFAYWPKPELFFHLGILQFTLNVVFGHILLIITYQSAKEKILKNQIVYVLLAGIFGFLGGSINFLPWYRIPIPPVTIIFVSIWVVLLTYAIVRYRLMDITLVITRTTIFIAVYSFVLGIPFALAFGWRMAFIALLGVEHWWMGPLVTSTVLATVGPFIYLYIQKRAEERLFKEQRRYQNTLRQASSGMGRIKDLKRLVNLTVHIITRTVKLEHSTLYLFDKQEKRFDLRAARSQNPRFRCPSIIEFDSELVSHLKRAHNPIVYEEIKQRSQDYADRRLHKLEEEVAALKAAVVVPAFIDERLLAVIVLGVKLSGQSYTEDDLTVFSILANQSALAIENAQFFADVKQTTEQLFKAEKMATIGTMADGLSHQINNRLHALGFIAGDALDTLKLKKNLANTPELKELFVDLERAFGRIEENVTHGGEIVRGLLRYTRKTEHGMTEVVLDEVIDSALSMTQFKIKPGELTVKREYDAKAVPKIRGNFAELQEVFFNLIDNAYDAMMQRKKERQEEGYQATITVTVSHPGDGTINIFVQDNGLGIREEDKEKLFTPFFTTKLSSQKGTGLGLFVIQKLVEENHKGRVHYQSEYGKGTLVHLHLPAVA